MKNKNLEFRKVKIREFAKDKDDDDDDGGIGDLSIIDIKAAIAKQAIPLSEIYSKQDLASNRDVMGLIHEAENKVKNNLEKEIIILHGRNKNLQVFRDKAETTTLVENSKELADKNERIVDYIKARLSTGRGVDLDGDLTDSQRQDKVNESIKEELNLIEDQGIIFKENKEEDDFKDDFKDDGDKQEDMTNAKNNPLIPRSTSNKT